MRNITNSKYNAHTEPIYKSLRLLKLNDLLRIKILKFYYMYSNNKLPEYFSGFQISLNSDLHRHIQDKEYSFIIHISSIVLQKIVSDIK